MTGIEIAPRPNERQPLKHGIRYARGVTVCIAVACQEKGEPRVVLCSDTRLDYAELGSTNRACKLDVLGYGWAAQLAGHWSGVQELSAIFRRKVQGFPPSLNSTDVAKAARSSVEEFTQSVLFDPTQEVQLLVSGFDSQVAVIFNVSVYPKKKVKIDSTFDFGSVGAGATIATTLLALRETHPRMPLSYAAYLAYEAKRASEKTGFVANFTTLALQAPPTHDDKERIWVKIMSEQGKAKLQGVYSQFWKVPFAQFPEFTDDCFIDPTEKQSPQ